MKLGIEEETIIGASQAATSDIHRLAMEDEIAAFSSSSSSTISLGGRAIDRCNPIIRDATRLGKVVQLTTARTKPPTSHHQPTTTPKHHNKNSKENTTNIHQTKKTSPTAPTTIKSCLKKANKLPSIANGADRMVNKTCSKPIAGTDEINVNNNTSPGDSSRYLLTTSSTMNIYSRRFDPLLTMVEQSPSTSSSSQPTFSSPASAASDDQVVVLRVSLHCKGCERKMRKHISKMKGVTSFNIDFAAKKLTVVGDVTPLSVLASVSKVKKAQLLTPPLVSSLTIPSSCSNNISAAFNKDKAILV